MKFNREYFGKNIILHIEFDVDDKNVTEKIIQHIKEHPFTYVSYTLEGLTSEYIDEKLIEKTFNRTRLLDEN